jgi:hypothetical protein
MNAPERKCICEYLAHISQLVKARDGSGESYTNSYYQCLKTKHRVSGRKACINCTMYKPLLPCETVLPINYNQPSPDEVKKKKC